MRKLLGDERTSLAMLALMFGLGVGGGVLLWALALTVYILRAVAERSRSPVTGYLANAH